MKVFLDTSALAKRYVEEPGSENMDDILASIVREAFVSVLAFSEFAAALGTKLRLGEIARDDAAKAMAEFELDWTDLFTKISLAEPLAESSARLAIQYALKSADAVHLASAQAAPIELFVASDKELLRAAAEVGFETYNPAGGVYSRP